MRILVAVDGSDPSRRAATRAADLARRLGESLTVVHVLPPPPIFSEPAVLPDVAELERRGLARGENAPPAKAGPPPPRGGRGPRAPPPRPPAGGAPAAAARSPREVP